MEMDFVFMKEVGPMKSKWKEMSTVNKAVLVARIILSIVIIILAFLQILGVLENALNYTMPLLGVYFLILSIQEWKTQRGYALFNISVALFIFIVAFVVWFGK